MGKQYRVNRKVATIPFADSGFATIDLPRNYDLESIFVRLSGNVTVSADATSVRAESPTQAISRIEVIADGKNTLFSAPYWFPVFANVARAMENSLSGNVTAPSSNVAATYAVEAIGVIDQAMMDGVRPKDTNFRTNGLQLFQLRVTFGALASLFVGGTISATNTLQVEIFTQETVELPNQDGSFTTPIGLKKVSYQELALTSSNTAQELRLPAGNLIKSVTFRTDGSTTAGEPSTAVLNNVQLASGVDVRFNLTGAGLRRKNTADYGLVKAGYYIADFAQQGQSPSNMTEFWDVSNQTEPKAILDVTGSANTKLQAVITEVILAVSK